MAAKSPVKEKKPAPTPRPGSNPPTNKIKPPEPAPPRAMTVEDVKGVVADTLNELNIGSIIAKVAETKVKEGTDGIKEMLKPFMPVLAKLQAASDAQDAAAPAGAPSAPGAAAAPPAGGGGLMALLPSILPFLVPQQPASPFAGMEQFFKTMAAFQEMARATNPLNDALPLVTGFMKLGLSAGMDPLKATEAIDQTFKRTQPPPTSPGNNGNDPNNH